MPRFPLVKGYGAFFPACQPVKGRFRRRNPVSIIIIINRLSESVAVPVPVNKGVKVVLRNAPV
jgi:hypothetical protein